MKRIPPLAWICALGITFTAGYFLGAFTSRVEEPSTAVAQAAIVASDMKEIRETEDFPLVQPLLECEPPQESHSLLKQSELERLVSDLEARQEISKVAVYVRDLDTGAWVGVREAETFNPASLKKVPLAIAAFLQAEREPKFLERRVAFTAPREGSDSSQAFPPAKSLEPGRSYTVLELVDRMLRYSDNEASWLLLETVTARYQQKVYEDVGLPFPDFTGAVDYALSNEQFARFFRLIYNATYLTPENSERLAEIMTRCAFTDGIVAGLPPGTPVAHKFGERGTPHGNMMILQLHDIGIVYNPRRHYLISVMTMGEDFKALSEAIAAVTRYVDQKVGIDRSLAAFHHH